MNIMENISEKNNKPRLITPVIGWFLVTMILANTASRMVYVLLPVYVRDELGATTSQVGLVFTLASLVPMVLQIFGGWLSDTIGRLPTIAIGAVVACVGYIGFAFAPTWQWVIVALMFEYVSGSLVGPSFGAFVADNSSEDNRAKLFGVITSIFQVVGIIGPPLGGYIADHYSYKTLMIVGAVIYILAAVVRIWMALTPRFKQKRSVEIGEHLTFANFRSSIVRLGAMIVGGGILTWIFIIDGGRDFTFQLSNSYEALYLVDIGQMSAQQIGWLNSIANVAMALAIAYSGWLAARISERKTIVLAYFIQFTGFVAFVLANSYPTFIFSWVLFGIGFGLSGPPFDSLISKAVPEENRGLAYGLFWTSISLLGLPAPYLGGLMWENVSPRAPFIITAGVVLLSILPAWLKFRLPQEKREVEPILVIGNN